MRHLSHLRDRLTERERETERETDRESLSLGGRSLLVVLESLPSHPPCPAMAPPAYRLPQGAFFLGFDSSTQSLKATVVDEELRIVAFDSVHFDSELPHYMTKDGVHRGSPGSGRFTAPVLMWVEALELLLDKLARANFDFGRVKAVSGSAQQHGSVYWKNGTLTSVLQKLNHSQPLHLQLRNAFSKRDSPVWMDSSTTEQCKAMEEAVGGAAAMATLTGSRAYERFTGPQIRKIFETEKEVYDNTERISLVSSFMASLLVGSYASIDHSDGAGMNLMNLKLRSWSPEALKATAPGLEEKLGELALPHAVAGKLNAFYAERYKFSPDCLVIQWSGDNPNSLAGLALNRPGDLAISLGTSDCVFGITLDPHPGLEGNVFPNPVDPNCYMLMLCYKNGSLAREEVRDRCANGSWEEFNKILSQTPPLNDGKIGFYYKETEILPFLPAGMHHYILDKLDSGSVHEVPNFDLKAEVRAIVEGQFLSMRAHCERQGMPSPPERVVATGGASANEQLLTLIGTIFGCPVYTTQRTDSASLGAAFRAAHGWLCQNSGTFIPISYLYEERPDDSAVHCQLSAPAGAKDLHVKYGFIASKRVELENQLLHKFSAGPVKGP